MNIKIVLTILMSIIVFCIIWIGFGKIVEQYVTGTPGIMFCGVLIYFFADKISGTTLLHLKQSLKIN
jgi:uncharacterized membrane protein